MYYFWTEIEVFAHKLETFLQVRPQDLRPSSFQ